MTENYDSRGIVTGLAVGNVFAQLEMRFVANRKAAFETAVATSDFKASALSQFDAYQRANAEAAKSAFANAKAIAEDELERSYEVGVSTTDRAVATYLRQGLTAEQPKTQSRSALAIVTAGIVSGFAQAAAYAQQSARQQYLQITSLVNPQGTESELRHAVDNAQAIFLHKGIGGRVDRDGYERSLSGETELLMRGGSHRVLVASEAERAGQYGLYYVLVSAHPSSCPLCMPWQDMVLIDDVYNAGRPDGERELLSTAQREGLGHPNCRHNWIAYVPGYDDPHLFAHEEDTPERTAQRYAVEQTQRANEGMICKWKRRAAGSLSPEIRANAENKVAEWQARQRALKKWAEERDIPFYRQYSREQIKPATPNIPSPESNLTPGWYGLHYPSVAKPSNVAKSDIGQNPNAYYNTLDAKDTDRITEIVRKADNPATKLFQRNADQIEVAKPDLRKSEAYYDPSDGKIHMDLTKSNADESRMPYKTFFHEVGHKLDAVSSGNADRSVGLASNFRSSKHVYTLNQLDKGGGKTSVTEGYTINQMLKKEAQDAIRSMQGGTKSEKVLSLRSALLDYDQPHSNGVSDMFAGATKNQVSGYWRHDRKYWQSSDSAAGNEAFAHMFAATVLDPQDLGYIRQYFPKTYEIFLEILEKIT